MRARSLRDVSRWYGVLGVQQLGHWRRWREQADATVISVVISAGRRKETLVSPLRILRTPSILDMA